MFYIMCLQRDVFERYSCLLYSSIHSRSPAVLYHFPRMFDSYRCQRNPGTNLDSTCQSYRTWNTREPKNIRINRTPIINACLWLVNVCIHVSNLYMLCVEYNYVKVWYNNHRHCRYQKHHQRHRHRHHSHHQRHHHASSSSFSSSSISSKQQQQHL